MPVIGDYASLTFDKILLATDFSPASFAAEEYALAFARRFHASVIVAHVLDLSILGLTRAAAAAAPLSTVPESPKRALTEIASRMSTAGIPATHRLLTGSESVPDQILQLSKEEDVNLIIVGTHSEKGVRRLVLGSSANAIMDRASCPVLTIGTSFQQRNTLAFDNVVLATDLGDASSLNTAVARSFAEDGHGRLYVCHVIEQFDQETAQDSGIWASAEKQLQHLAAGDISEYSSTEYLVEFGDVSERLVQLCKKVDADLLVMGPSRRGAWLRHLTQGTNAKVLEGVSCPVLTVAH